LRRRRRLQGEDLPYTLRAAHNLARDLAALGEYQQACSLHEDTLTRYRRVLGDDHLYTRQAVADLATVSRAVGQTNE
jgi:hypothetical protein